MTFPRWTRAIWLLGSIAAIGPVETGAQTLPTLGGTGTGPPDGASDKASNPTPRSIIESADATQGARDSAALRMVAWRSAEAHADALAILQGGFAPAETAVARAVASVGWADRDFVQPLMAVLQGRDPAAAAAAASALGLFTDDTQVADQLILEAKSDRPDIRQPVIRALGNFTQKSVAGALLSILEHDESDQIRETAGNSLQQMTGRYDLDHNTLQWAQWWTTNGNLGESAFDELIVRGRGQAFEGQVADHRTLENAADDYLRADFFGAASPERRRDILISYLQSPAPEIRALGCEIVLSASANIGDPPGTIEQTRLLLRDPSPQVRAAAAAALSTDPPSAPEMVAQLNREPDDLVRLRLITSLQPFQDPGAIQEMLNLIESKVGTSDVVKIAAAQGVRAGSQAVNSDAAMKQRAEGVLEESLKGTDAPDRVALRESIVAALASIHDDGLADLFRRLLTSKDEDIGVRASALVGLGNLPDSGRYAAEIARHLEDDDSIQMRLAAIEALRQPPSPIPQYYINKLLSMMSSDASDQVRAAAWEELQYWAGLPNMDEDGLSALAQGLKSQPAKELLIRQKLADRLEQDVQNNTPALNGHSAAQELADEQQTIGDLLMSPALNHPGQAATAYRSALDYWKANAGRPDVIDRLCRDIVSALLSARQYDDAATFASGVIQQYSKDQNLMVISERVAQEFVGVARDLGESTDPGAYGDAMALFAAVSKMSPPLPGDYPDQLSSLKASIQARHLAEPQP